VVVHLADCLQIIDWLPRVLVKSEAANDHAVNKMLVHTAREANQSTKTKVLLVHDDDGVEYGDDCKDVDD